MIDTRSVVASGGEGLTRKAHKRTYGNVPSS